MAPLKDLSSTAQKAAQTFINFVMGDGQKILNDFGFVSP
jgi:ABC-type phosphate transport system substrate-binding protein